MTQNSSCVSQLRGTAAVVAGAVLALWALVALSDLVPGLGTAPALLGVSLAD